MNKSFISTFSLSLVLGLCLSINSGQTSSSLADTRSTGNGQPENTASTSNSAKTCLNQAKACLDKGNYKGAIPQLEKYVEENPQDCEGHLCLGRAYVKAAKLDKAKLQFRQAIKVGKGSVNAQAANQQLLTMPTSMQAPKTGLATRLIASTFGLIRHDRGAEGVKNMPTVIDFYASWCQPCKKLSGQIAQAKQKFGTTVNFISVNVDDPDNEELIDQYEISPIPTVIFLNNTGEVVTYAVGYSEDNQLQKGIEKILPHS